MPKPSDSQLPNSVLERAVMMHSNHLGRPDPFPTDENRSGRDDTMARALRLRDRALYWLGVRT